MNDIAMDLRDPRIDFVALAQSMGVPAQGVTGPQAVDVALRESYAQAGPTLVEIVVHDGFEARQ